MNQSTSIDAVRMVRKIWNQHYEHTKDMTVEERVAFYREKHESCADNWGETKIHLLNANHSNRPNPDL